MRGAALGGGAEIEHSDAGDRRSRQHRADGRLPDGRAIHAAHPQSGAHLSVRSGAARRPRARRGHPGRRGADRAAADGPFATRSNERQEPRAAMNLRDSLERGAALFNDRQFWEAHEAWEEAWLELENEEKLFLQGLIQVAAGYYKATVQNQPRGCVSLLTSALEKLEPLPAD